MQTVNIYKYLLVNHQSKSHKFNPTKNHHPWIIVRLLQNHSRGNPGWCESFLVTLMQNGGLKIEDIPVQEVKRKSLILPDINLVTKKSFILTQSQLFDRDKMTTSNKDINVQQIDYENRDDFKRQSIVSVCVVASNFDISENVIPQNMEGLIMTAFDCLTPYAQLLLKCASVLGDTFTRNMLVAVMHNPTPYQTAEAVKHLFELRVLNCGTTGTETTVTRPSNNFVVQELRRSISERDRTAYCNCHVLPDVKSEKDSPLPNYAFCRLLHFRIPQFRDATYELLPGNQKKNFHERAVEFLENETHKCNSCGGGNFIYVIPEDFEIESISGVQDEPLIQETRSVIAPHPSMLRPSRSHRVSPRTDQDMTHSNMDTVLSQDQIAQNKKKMRTTFFNQRKLSDKKSDSYITIEHPNNVVDFRNCECPFILTGVYQQLINHCSAAGLKEKHVRFLIEYGAAAITIGNNTQAIHLLEEAEELCKAESENVDQHLSHSVQRHNLARIHALIGQANLDLGQLSTARKHLGIAMSNFGKTFPTWHVLAVLKLQWEMCKQLFHQQFPRVFLGRTHGKKAIIYNEIAACLSHLNNLYMVEQKWLLAKLAAVQSLNLAQSPNSNLYELCAAYSNIMDVLHHYGKLNYCLHLESMALKAAKEKYVGEEAKELLALGRLYCATFSSRSSFRLLRGKLLSAIKTGFRTLQISNRVYANNVKLFVLPMLIQALLMNHRMVEAVDLLRELAFTAEEDLDQSSATWYHALCLDIILDTCFTVEKPSTCCAFGEKIASGIIVRDPDSVRRLAISMWIWYTRKQEWIQAKKWEDRVSQYKDIRSDDSFSNLISSLKYLECMLVSITARLDSSRPTSVVSLRSDIITFISKLEKVAKVTKIILPRFLFLKAYFNTLRHYKAKAMKLLAEATQVSEQQHNLLDLTWIKHNMVNWSGTENNIDEVYWQEHSGDNTCIDWHEFNMHNSTKMVYSFPVPANHL